MPVGPPIRSIASCWPSWKNAGCPQPGRPTAERLLRRLSLVLTGLPPTPEEVDAFLADPSPTRLRTAGGPAARLAALRRALGRHWLDVVRFAETLGNEWNYEVPFAWRYRDYVIRAFNEDVPYDRLVREHMAGDLLPSRAGTGGKGSTNR